MSRTIGFFPLVAALAVAATACQEPPATPVADETIASMEADQVAYGVENYLTADGIRSALIVSDTAYVFNDSSTVLLWGVDMTLYNDDGSRRARLTSSRGRLNERTEQLTAWGDVVVVVEEGNRRIESPELHYDPQGNEIWSDSASTMIQNGRATRGSCFRSTLDFTNTTVCDIRGAADVSREARPGGDDDDGGGDGGP